MFDWLGESPAAGVQWVDVILSFTAFGIAIVALPTILQMFWGRPLLRVEFDRAVEDQERMLAVYLKNPPIKSRTLSRMGVRRESIQSLAASFQIAEVGSGRVLDPIRHGIFFTDEELEPRPKERVALPPTYSVATSFGVAKWMPDTNSVVVPPDRLRGALPLAAGYYLAKVVVMVDGEPKNYERRFKVGANPDDLVWTTPVT